jgi:hypothetical protein
MTPEELISSMGYGWKYETTESSARLVAEHAIETMYSEEDMLKSFMAGIKCESKNGKNFEQFIKQFKNRI